MLPPPEFCTMCTQGLFYSFKTLSFRKEILWRYGPSVYPCCLSKSGIAVTPVPLPLLRTAQCTHQWKCSHIHTRRPTGEELSSLPLSFLLSCSFSSIDQTDDGARGRARRRGKRTWIICRGSSNSSAAPKTKSLFSAEKRKNGFAIPLAPLQLGPSFGQPFLLALPQARLVD